MPCSNGRLHSECHGPVLHRSLPSSGSSHTRNSAHLRGRLVRREVGEEVSACQVESCTMKRKSRGLCSTHYYRKMHNLPEAGRAPRKCSIEGCDKKHRALGYCLLHYERQYHGTPMHKMTRVKSTAKGEWSPWRLSYQGYLTRKRGIGGGRAETQFQHRVVMEEILGRSLLKHENVHHINGVRDDNRPENLELWSKSQPAGQRVTDKLAWAREIIALYEGEVSRHGQIV